MSGEGPVEPTEPSEPVEPDQPIEHTAPLDLAAEDHGGDGGSGSRRVAIIAAVAVAIAAVLGGGAYAAYTLLSGGGPRPAEALPSSTVAILSVDLDPSAGQKIAAIKTIRKFPALKKSLGLNADDDLREFAFDKLTDGGCNGINFDDDVSPWLGKRAAFAAVDLGDKDPAPAIALQVTDPVKAKKAFAAIVKCAEPGDDFAFVVGDDYLIASDSPAHAQAILEKGEKAPLSDDKAYQKWTDAAGDQGVVTFYVAKKAVDYLVDELASFGGFLSSGSAEDDPTKAAKKALAKFQGLGGTVRFADGGMELAMAGGGLSNGSATVGKKVGALPKDTAVAFGLGVPDGYAKTFVDQFKGAAGTDTEDFISQAETETGLDLPDDLQTLLGDALTLSLGGEAPATLDDLAGPDELPVGLLIHGDADKIEAVIEKIEERTGLSLSDVPVVLSAGDGKVALSPSSEYADELLKSGSLGSSANFKAAVPDADRAMAILYVNFDSPWRNIVIDLIGKDSSSDAKDFDANTKPLKSLGVSSWVDGDVTHALVKIATD
jgi:hypothetical protein